MSTSLYFTVWNAYGARDTEHIQSVNGDVPLWRLSGLFSYCEPKDQRKPGQLFP